jgi:hypothetical protein
MQGRPKGAATTKSSNPGPGHYTPMRVGTRSTHAAYPGIKVPTTVEKQDVGPGSYEPDSKPISKNFRFGTGGRTNFVKSNAPGPEYDCRREVAKIGSGYSFGKQTKSSF